MFKKIRGYHFPWQDEISVILKARKRAVIPSKTVPELNGKKGPKNKK
jgi:hypothetical protein